MIANTDSINEDEQWDRYALLEHFDRIEWELGNMPNLNLETLDMDNCDLTKVPPAITEIEYYAFRDVQAVSFNNNPIANADILGKLQDLQAINMWSCGLDAIPSSWSSLNKLQVLGLGHSKTLSSFGPIKKLTNITWLDLGGCQLKTIPDEVTHLTKLIVLALGDNEGIEIDDSICCFWNLRKLALNNCALESVPEPVFSLIKLSHLHLDDNHLPSIEPDISHLKDLKELSVIGNNNVKLPKVLGKMEKLKRIVVDDTIHLGGVTNEMRNKFCFTLPTAKRKEVK